MESGRPDQKKYKERMSTFDKKSSNKVNLKYTTTHQYSTSKTVKSNSYLISKSINNYTTSDNFINTTYKVDVTPIKNDWEYYKRNDGDETLISHNNRLTNQKLNIHIQKLNGIYFRTKSFEQQCVLLHALLTHGEFSDNC